MYRNAKRFFSICFAVLVVLLPFPFAATAQTSDNQSSLVKTVTGALSPDVSGDLLQDSSFLAALQARDAQIALETELEEISSFNEERKDDLGKLLQNLPVKVRESYLSMIQDELDRLKTLEPDIKSGLEIHLYNTIGDGVKSFEAGGYPLALNEKVVNKLEQSVTGSPIEFARRGREQAAVVFRNVSHENKPLLYDYQRFFSSLESFGTSDMTVPLSESLPPEFYKLGGAQSYEAITEPQLKSAISKYEEVLKLTRNIVKLPPSVTKFITDSRNSFDALSLDLQRQNDKLRGDVEKLNKTIASTGRLSTEKRLLRAALQICY